MRGDGAALASRAAGDALPAALTRHAPLLAMAAGALNVFAFAPFGLWPLQIATLALAFLLVLGSAGWRSAALIGAAYGFGWLAAGVHWLYISMHYHGGLPAWLAVLAVGVLALGMGGSFAALAFGAARAMQQKLGASRTAGALLILPGWWALAEWSRGWFLTGFPWLSSGYAHSDGPLSGFAPLVGVYGLALLSALAAGCLALLPHRRLPLLGALALLATGFGARSVAWTEPVGAPISVRLLQGNVPQEMKFAPEQIQASLALYHRMVTSQPADLIATPETAIPLLSSQLPPDYLGLLQDFLRRSNSSLALGLPVSDGPGQYANSVLGMGPEGGMPYRYDKHHLVPFGEFIPPGFRWFVDMMRIPLGDFERGEVLQRPFKVRDQWVLPNVCYEDLFGEEIAAQLSAPGMPRATMLLNVSNIAWFGDSIAVPQHLQISRMRSLETGRPMLRATNTGATAVIGADGRVQAQLEPYTRGELAALVQGHDGLTPYSRYGNALAVGLALALLALAWLGARRVRAMRPAP
ncbi:apolipoprotein N-acyltransferase [Noviherbaspirillum aridicola]|uniref:Apolipoprotein N-acyltransferase n=1 Tax=Noviherbaspirillum aridicola TaxID=2849687 RepID=A0ABQ4Q7F9_9BURK|nr:apolipoprotein N-acyltransferase [Noviherbaspirillum aridicola]